MNEKRFPVLDHDLPARMPFGNFLEEDGLNLGSCLFKRVAVRGPLGLHGRASYHHLDPTDPRKGPSATTA